MREPVGTLSFDDTRVKQLDLGEAAACFFKSLPQHSCADLNRLPVGGRREAQDDPAVLLPGRGNQTIVLPKLCNADIAFLGADRTTTARAAADQLQPALR